MKKIGITGASGYVGDKMLKIIPNSFPLNFDVTNFKQVGDVMNAERPDIVLHLAGITNVDKCQEPENEKRVFQVNVVGTQNVGDACARYDSQLVLLSTYHVFNGRRKFGLYTEKSRPNPLNYYGFTKLACEGMRLTFPFMKIVRTSYLFDYNRLQDKIRALNTTDQYYPTFQSRSFLHIKHFCEMMGEYLGDFNDDVPSILHIAGSESVSWYDFMRRVSLEFKTKYSVAPRTDELKLAVPRPKKGGLSVANSDRLGYQQHSFEEGVVMMEKLGI